MAYYMQVLCPLCSSAIDLEIISTKQIEGGIETTKIDRCTKCHFMSEPYMESFTVTNDNPLLGL